MNGSDGPLYPIVEIQPEWVLEDEQMGSKKKFWFREADDALDWLFKYPQANTGQHWAEKIAAEVARAIDILHARVDLALFEGARGSATESFVRDGRELFHGNQVLAGQVTGYDPEKRFQQCEHTLGNIFAALGQVFESEEAARAAVERIAQYLVLDALIGNTDRHHDPLKLVRRASDKHPFIFGPALGRLDKLDRVVLARIVDGVPESWMSERARAFAVELMCYNLEQLIKSPLMNDKTLFLAWQDKRLTRGWFPVGRLDVLRGGQAYRFLYTQGARRAQMEAGFDALLDFPKLDKVYDSRELFPLFKNRVISPGRGDFADYVRMLDLPRSADPVEILSVGGGSKATDSFEVFPKIEKRADGFFTCRFFLHGWRHVSPAAIARLDELEPGEKLYVTIELTNPATGLAVQIQTKEVVRNVLMFIINVHPYK